jgi:Fe-S-cluster containining protein
MRLEAELRRARDLDIAELADAIESIGFECTRCGACCRGETEDPHTATVFPDEVRELAGEDRDWREVARPMPFGLSEDEDGEETFEWALQTDGCGDCTFYDDEGGACTVYGDRPLICQTYPFSVALDGAAEPMGDPVDSEGVVRAHECEGLGRDISRADAEALARTLKERAVREVEEAIAVRDSYEPTDADGVVVHDSEGQKRPDGAPVERQD